MFQRDQFALLVDARFAPRVLQQYQCQQSDILRLVWQQLAKHATEANRFTAKVGSNQTVARSCAVSLVEDQIDYGLHCCEALAQNFKRGNFIGNSSQPNLAFGSHQSLCQRRLRQEKSPGNFNCGETAQSAQSESDLRFATQRRMTASENQTQPVIWIFHVFFDQSRLVIRLKSLNFILEFRLLFGFCLFPAHCVEQLAMSHRRQPGARVARRPCCLPICGGGSESLLQRLFGGIERSGNSNPGSNDSSVLFTKNVLEGLAHLRHGCERCIVWASTQAIVMSGSVLAWDWKFSAPPRRLFGEFYVRAIHRRDVESAETTQRLAEPFTRRPPQSSRRLAALLLCLRAL